MTEKSDLFSNLSRIAGGRVLCLGDVMLDKFIYGAVDRISPEAPIPVFLVTREKHALGGAGNVAANIAALGAEVCLISVTGDDSAGADLQRRLRDQGIDAVLEAVIDRPTTVKTRFVGSGQQMLRVDRESSEKISADTEKLLMKAVAEKISGAGAVILSDYGKGVLTDELIAYVIATAKKKNVPVIVDPKGRDFSRYRGAFAVTPNRKELEIASGMTAESDESVRAAAMRIIIDCGIDTVLATRSRDGMSLISAAEEPVHIPTQAREVFDVSGAGDTVIAVFATALAAGINVTNAALIANAAAGIVVGKAGTATAGVDEISAALESGAAVSAKTGGVKVASLGAATAQAERLKARGQKIGFTNGCFDLLHPGHLSTLRQAKAACDYLVVGLNSDASVKRLKGQARPVQDEAARAGLLSALAMVDMVVVFEEDTPIELIRAVKPDVLVKGGQYNLEEVVGYDIVTSYGGKILRADMVEGESTTNTIKKIG